MPDLPEEAVEAAMKSCRARHLRGLPGGLEEGVLEDVGAAAPAIRQQAVEEARLARVGKLVEERAAIRKQEQGQIVTRLLARNLLTVEIEEAIRGPLEDSDD